MTGFHTVFSLSSYCHDRFGSIMNRYGAFVFSARLSNTDYDLFSTRVISLR
jgi:hypothetical protein